MRVLIAGCGYVGIQLGLMLSEAGHQVFGLRRDPSSLPKAISGVSADLVNRSSLDALPESIDRVVYAAGAKERTASAYQQTYVEGFKNLLDAALIRSAGLERVVFVSSTAVYGQTDGQWVDETSPAEPTGFSGRTLLEAERIATQAAVQGIVLRLGGIYGPNRTGAIERFKRLSASTLRADASEAPPRYTNRIHRDDAAGALGHLLTLQNPEPLYLGVDNEPAAEREVSTWLAARVDAAATTPLAIPAPRRSESNKRCSNRRLRDSGYKFAYPTFREGYQSLLSS